MAFGNNSNPLVTKVIQARHYPDTDILNATLRNNMSYAWRSLFDAQEIIKQGCRKRIENGKDTRVYKVPWLPCLENGYLATVIHKELEQAAFQSLMDESETRWDEDILYDLL